MIYKLKKEEPGFYKVIVNNYNRYDIRRTERGSDPTNIYYYDWVVTDLENEKKYIDFVSLKEAKDFIKEELFHRE
jgi:hypothetical protein